MGDVTAPLTEKQEAFVKYYVDDQMSKSAAARAAGYVNQNLTSVGATLVKIPKVAKAIALRQEEFAKASQITKKKVVDGFLEAIEMAKLKADPLTMVAGWREIGKLCGLYEATKHKIDISVGGKMMIEKMSALSDDELLKLAEQELEDNTVDVEARDVTNDNDQ